MLRDLMRGITKIVGFVLLMSDIVFCTMLYGIEVLVKSVSKNPKGLLGGTPTGSKPVVKGWAWMISNGSAKIRELLGIYVRRYYPRIYQRGEDKLWPSRP